MGPMDGGVLGIHSAHRNLGFVEADCFFDFLAWDSSPLIKPPFGGSMFYLFQPPKQAKSKLLRMVMEPKYLAFRFGDGLHHTPADPHLTDKVSQDW